MGYYTAEVGAGSFRAKVLPMTTDVINEIRLAAIKRLTPAERECLRRCLEHQTAKQMAIDLGISAQAVEKRLKMARAKLGLSSSLEAAKLVETVDRSHRLGPSPSDLSPENAQPDQGGTDAAPRHETSWIKRIGLTRVVSGVILMSLILAAALMLASSPSAFQDQTSPVSTASESAPTPGTEAALRRLVAGLASGAPDYNKLAPQFAEIVRRDLPMTHPMFKSMGELKSITFRNKGPMGDDGYDLTFANGKVLMSAALDAQGRMAGGILAPQGVRAPGH